jgi:hypothetical protein
MAIRVRRGGISETLGDGGGRAAVVDGRQGEDGLRRGRLIACSICFANAVASAEAAFGVGASCDPVVIPLAAGLDASGASCPPHCRATVTGRMLR